MNDRFPALPSNPELLMRSVNAYALMAAALRWNLFVYRDLREWLRDPVAWDVEPPDIEQLFLNIPGIGQRILERRG